MADSVGSIVDRPPGFEESDEVGTVVAGGRLRVDGRAKAPGIGSVVDAPPGYPSEAHTGAASDHYRFLARQYASEAGIKPDVFEKQIDAESSFDPKALSKSGAIGLGQLMPATATALGVKDPWNPDENLRASAQYLAQRLAHYGGDYVKAIASYNGGEGAVQHAERHGTYRGWGSPGDPDETYNYVRKILGEAALGPPHDTREADFRVQSQLFRVNSRAGSGGASVSALAQPLFGTASASVPEPKIGTTVAVPPGYPPDAAHPASKPQAVPPHSMLEQIGAAVMGPAEIVPGIAATDGQWAKAWDEFRRNPAEARAHYGLLGVISAGRRTTMRTPSGWSFIRAKPG